MKLLMILAVAVVIAVVARAADAAEKHTPKPVVCASYRVLEPGMAVCSDNAKPFLMRRFVEVVAPGSDDGSVKVLVGWR